MKLLLACSLLLSFAFFVDGAITEHRRFKRGQQRYEAGENFSPKLQASVEMEPSETVIKKTYRTYKMQPTVVKKYISYGGRSIDGGTLDLSNLGSMNTDTVNLGGNYRVIQGSPIVRRFTKRVRMSDLGRGSMPVFTIQKNFKGTCHGPPHPLDPSIYFTIRQIREVTNSGAFILLIRSIPYWLLHCLAIS